MASSAISKLATVLTLAVSFLTASAQCNLDKQATNTPSEAARPATSPNYAAWLKEDVRWIITDEERAAFTLLKSDQERDQFIEQFWRRRDPTPETPLNEFKQEHYQRLLYANQHFATPDTPGWRTDRGRIYIVYGKPDGVTSAYKRDERAETWRYRYIDGLGHDVQIEFVDRCRCGNLLQVTDLEQLKAAQQGVRIIDPVLFSGTVPIVRFKDLDEIVSHKICMNVVPVAVSTSQAKVTDYTVLVPIKVKVKDKDLGWQEEHGERRRTLNAYGRVTSQKDHIEEIFEGTIQQKPDQAGQDFTYTYNVPLRSGIYRINVVVRDAAEDRKGTWSGTIMVP